MTPAKKKEYIIMEKDTGKVLHEGIDRRPTLENAWSFLGLTSRDYIKMFFYFAVAVSCATKFCIAQEATEQFIIEQVKINAHLNECSDNRDKWATAKYGHSFTCGKPDDGWHPNMSGIMK